MTVEELAKLPQNETAHVAIFGYIMKFDTKSLPFKAHKGRDITNR
jgi:hypothetical protein